MSRGFVVIDPAIPTPGQRSVWDHIGFMEANIDTAPDVVDTLVWETGDDGRVTREDVDNDPNTLIACGWVR